MKLSVLTLNVLKYIWNYYFNFLTFSKSPTTRYGFLKLYVFFWFRFCVTVSAALTTHHMCWRRLSDFFARNWSNLLQCFGPVIRSSASPSRSSSSDMRLPIDAVESSNNQPSATLQQLANIFVKPIAIIPRRACDHQVLTLLGHNQYGYYWDTFLITDTHLLSKMKSSDRVAELLKSGVIQGSTSAFASLAIVVQKRI